MTGGEPKGTPMIEFTESSKDYLTASERAALCRLSRRVPIVRATLHQLERILTGQTFARVQRRTGDFLRFIVSKTLIGRVDEIKELTVACRVFHETDFNPLENSKVRVAGLALRRRLAAYYAREGTRDPIEIAIPVGRYAPRIRFHPRWWLTRPREELASTAARPSEIVSNAVISKANAGGSAGAANVILKRKVSGR
jgi:hypothetical protein